MTRDISLDWLRTASKGPRPLSQLDQRPLRQDGVLAQEAGGRTVLLRIEDGSYYVIEADGELTPARVQFVTADGRYIAPLGHRDEVNPALLEDSGADVLLGSAAYAYVPGDFEIDLPIGPVTLEVVKGFEHRPVRLEIEVDASTRELSVDLERVIDATSDGWHSADPHVHYLAPSTALVQAAAEDVELVHLLATQAGDLVTSGPDVWWGSIADPSGRHRVEMGTENRQNLLGHLTLLGARRPTLPMAAGS